MAKRELLNLAAELIALFSVAGATVLAALARRSLARRQAADSIHVEQRMVEPHGRATHGRRRPVAAAAALASYLVFAVFLFLGAWLSPQTAWVGDYGDPLQVVWFLRWVPFAVSHHLNPLVTDYLNYPDGINVMWNSSVLLPGLLLSPITTTFGPVLAYNTLATLAVALSGWSAYLAGRHFGARPLAAGVGGFLYGFSPQMVAHALGHPNFTLGFTPPLLLIALDEILVRQRLRSLVAGALMGLLTAAQLLIGEEVLATEAVVGLLGLILLTRLNAQAVASKAPYAIRALAAGTVVCLVMTGVPLGFQFLGPQQIHSPIWPRNLVVTDLLGFVLPTELQIFAPGWATAISNHFSTGIAEAGAYLGGPLIVVLGYGAVRLWRSRTVRFFSFLALLVALLSMGWTIHVAGRPTHVPVAALGLAFLPLGALMPSGVMLVILVVGASALYQLPILNSILPARLMNYFFLLASLVLMFFVDSLPYWKVGRIRFPTALVVVLAVIPLLPRWPFPAPSAPVPTFFRAEGVSRIPEGSVVLVVPYEDTSGDKALRGESLPAMQWQADANMHFRMPGGYATVPDPPAGSTRVVTGDVLTAIQRGQETPSQNNELRRKMLTELERWNIRAVVVGPLYPPERQDRMVRLFTWLIGPQPEHLGGVYVWWRVDETISSTLEQLD